MVDNICGRLNVFCCKNRKKNLTPGLYEIKTAREGHMPFLGDFHIIS